MSTEKLRRDPGRRRVVAKATLEAFARCGRVRRTDAEKHSALRWAARPDLDVLAERASHRGYEREHRLDPGLWSHHAQRAVAPRDVIESQGQGLANAHAVRGHQQKRGMVPLADDRRAIDRRENLLHVAPGQRSRWG